MGDKYQTGSPVLDAQAMELIDEYVSEVRAGNIPNNRKFLERYRGPNGNTLKVQLNIFTTLALLGKKRSKEWKDGMEASEKIRKAIERAYKRLFSDDV